RAAAPTLDPPADIVRAPRSEIRLALRAADGAAPVQISIARVTKDGATITVPDGMAIDERGRFVWLPTESQVGHYEIALAAKDAPDARAEARFHVQITEPPITADGGPAGQLLKKWQAEGTAAGNIGDFYDNRDRDHSPLHLGTYPQLDHIVYSED